MLTITPETLDEAVILHCLGRIVCGYETALLCAALRQERQNVVLDLTEVEAIDAAGIGALVSLQASGVYLKLMNPTQPVREILKVTNLDSIFEISESRGTCEALGTAPAPRLNNRPEKFRGAQL
jgi:anti-anti-sigma factor